MIPIKPANFDSYITAFPEETQELLEQLRATIKKAAPEAREIISYGMPAFKLNKILVYFAAHKNHIGFYPGVSGIEVFKEEIKGYKWAKGTVQFPFDQPLPVDLITRIVKFRVNELSMISKTKKR